MGGFGLPLAILVGLAKNSDIGRVGKKNVLRRIAIYFLSTIFHDLKPKLASVQQHPRQASVRIICVVSAAHDVTQVGLLCGSATLEIGLCVGPQHRILFGAHAGCSVVRCPFFRRGFVISCEQ